MENVLTIANVTEIREDKNGNDYFLVSTEGYFDKDETYFMGQSLFLRDTANHGRFKVGGKVVAE
jgi:hypothetical protein